MQSFLREVVTQIWNKHQSFDSIIFVLPSKRAGVFLKNLLADTAQKPIFSPPIYSIESFVEEMAQLCYTENTQLLFELYGSYTEVEQGERDSFYTFSQWGQTLLQDFNEVDRYLIDPDKLFHYLSAIKELNHWSLAPNKTQMVQDYLRFWKLLPQLYQHYGVKLRSMGIGYQGLVYREACDNLPTYLQKTHGKTHVFLGFNALNTAESKIIQYTLEETPAEIYWDLDRSFYEDPIHEAGYFLRQHISSWPYYKSHEPMGLGNHYGEPKNIQIVGLPKNVSQAQYVGELLQQKRDQLQHTALVLGDESLLNPILHALPPLEAINITMGYPLRHSPMAGFFGQFLDLYQHPANSGWYHKEVVDFLSNPYSRQLFHKQEAMLQDLLGQIKTRNKSYYTLDDLQKLHEVKESPLWELFFEERTPQSLVAQCQTLVTLLRSILLDGDQQMELEHLFRFHTLFNQLEQQLQAHSFLTDIRTLKNLFHVLMDTETLDFKGEPLQGLQIMGMLESRNLDFETVILTSVNEGILPSGKSNNSFIPFDVKKDFGLPTYKEKDAVYTYHFYRLLQRAKNIYLLYNTEADVLEGGERSRFIAQLLADPAKEDQVIHHIATPALKPSLPQLRSITKDPSLIEALQQLGKRGFSPTALGNYIRNPLDFYKQSILGINEVEEVEENIAANTFGTIVHDTLEALYKPFLGQQLTAEGLEAAKQKIVPTVQYFATEHYKDGNLKTGKNLIAYQVILKYVETFLEMEIQQLAHSSIKLVHLEQKLEMPLHIPELGIPILLKGKLDRVDERDGTLHIIDYKTGKVLPKNVTVSDWEEVITDYDKNKAFQLLCYALMFAHSHGASSMEAGIYSFKNLSGGYLPFKKNGTIIDQQVLEEFKDSLASLLLDMFNPAIPFTEKEV